MPSGKIVMLMMDGTISVWTDRALESGITWVKAIVTILLGIVFVSKIRRLREKRKGVQALVRSTLEHGETADILGLSALSEQPGDKRIAEEATQEPVKGVEEANMKTAEEAKAPLIWPEPGPIIAQDVPQQSTIETRFTVGELIAEGGMAQVFRATENATQQIVIWKQAYAKFSPISVSNQKLKDEVELLQIVRHPRIPSYLAEGEITDDKDDTRIVLIQEFIEGGDLKNTVEQVKKLGMVMPLEKAREILMQICEPLEHMASLPSPIYHRDLKPHNIIVHPDRGPVLIDFGLAKMVETGSDVSVTRGGSGTWTPPERDSGVSGPFTDVWSLGKILYYLLTNEVPPAILDQDDIASKFAECERPEWLAQFVVWSCWPQHAKRIQSVQQFRILLENEGKWPEGESIDSAASDSGDFTTWG